jgi:hypothetical protein
LMLLRLLRIESAVSSTATMLKDGASWPSAPGARGPETPPVADPPWVDSGGESLAVSSLSA